MDYLGVLKDNTSKVLSKSKKIREFIDDLIDENSFVETDVFMSGKSFLDGSDALGEGVITGYATIKEYPVCLVAQNSEVLGGSLCKAHADKILKCINRSIETNTPLISIIDSTGARLGEGMSVLEGYAQIIAAVEEMREYVPHFSVIKGNAIGLMGMYASCSDFIFMSEKGSVLSANPPMTLAENVNDQPKNIVGGKAYAEHSLLSTVTFKKPKELRDKIIKLYSYLGEAVIENEDDPNRSSDILNSVANPENLISALADEESSLEMFSEYALDIKTVFATINSIPVGLIITNGEYLNKFSIEKAKAFIEILDKYNLPLVTMINSKGIESNLSDEQQGIVLSGAKLISCLSKTCIPKIAVITDYAIGYSYVSLASKATGYDYALAFANAKIAPITSEAAASILYNKDLKQEGEPFEIREKLSEKYKLEEMNPFISAKEGYIDNIIEPALIRPYVASALIMLLK